MVIIYNMRRFFYSKYKEQNKYACRKGGVHRRVRVRVDTHVSGGASLAALRVGVPRVRWQVCEHDDGEDPGDRRERQRASLWASDLQRHWHRGGGQERGAGEAEVSPHGEEGGGGEGEGEDRSVGAGRPKYLLTVRGEGGREGEGEERGAGEAEVSPHGEEGGGRGRGGGGGQECGGGEAKVSPHGEGGRGRGGGGRTGAWGQGGQSNVIKYVYEFNETPHGRNVLESLGGALWRPLQVRAIDPDVHRNSIIEYSLTGQFSDDKTFSINKRSGEVSTEHSA